MSGQVDVLAVMDDAAETLARVAQIQMTERAEEMREARAAVAALIAERDAQDLEQRARELLDKHIDRNEPRPYGYVEKYEALEAITDALRQQPAPVVPAYEVFRIAGGDTECEPNPTPERALEVLRDLRACYDEALCDQPAPVVDDAMVDRYLTAVHKHLGGLPSEQWDRDREDGGATLRRIARIGLTAALARAQGVQS